MNECSMQFIINITIFYTHFRTFFCKYDQNYIKKIFDSLLEKKKKKIEILGFFMFY